MTEPKCRLTRKGLLVALTKAGRATGDFGEDEAQLLTQRTLKVLRHRFVGAPPTVEQVQDVVEQMLVDANQYENVSCLCHLS